jgi:hypothetical protein
MASQNISRQNKFGPDVSASYVEDGLRIRGRNVRIKYILLCNIL